MARMRCATPAFRGRHHRHRRHRPSSRHSTRAPRPTVALYFHVRREAGRPVEWSSRRSPRRSSRTRVRKSLVGRGAVNQKGPEAAFLARCTRFAGGGRRSRQPRTRRGGRGGDRIATLRQVVANPDVKAALKRTIGVYMPSAFQDPTAAFRSFLVRRAWSSASSSPAREVGTGSDEGCALVESRRLDSPAFRLVQALATSSMRRRSGHRRFGREAKAATVAEREMLDEAATKMSEETAKSFRRRKVGLMTSGRPASPATAFDVHAGRNMNARALRRPRKVAVWRPALSQQHFAVSSLIFVAPHRASRVPHRCRFRLARTPVLWLERRRIVTSVCECWTSEMRGYRGGRDSTSAHPSSDPVPTSRRCDELALDTPFAPRKIETLPSGS